MINLNRKPQTDAEAHVAYLLTEVARIGRLYSEFFFAQPFSDTADNLRYVLEKISPTSDTFTIYALNEVNRQFKALDKANKQALKFVSDMLIKAIDDFNDACNKVKEDPRDRTVILKSEGWRKTEKGWTRGKITVPE